MLLSCAAPLPALSLCETKVFVVQSGRRSQSVATASVRRPPVSADPADISLLLDCTNELIAEVGELDGLLARGQDGPGPVSVGRAVQRLHSRSALRLLVKAGAELRLLRDEAGRVPRRAGGS